MRRLARLFADDHPEQAAEVGGIDTFLEPPRQELVAGNLTPPCRSATSSPSTRTSTCRPMNRHGTEYRLVLKHTLSRDIISDDLRNSTFTTVPGLRPAGNVGRAHSPRVRGRPAAVYLRPENARRGLPQPGSRHPQDPCPTGGALTR